MNIKRNEFLLLSSSRTPCTVPGFTLLELLMILMIVSMVGMIVSPSLMEVSGALNVNGEARRIRAKIREAQHYAINQQKAHRMSFDLANDQFDILDVSSGSVLIETVALGDQYSFVSTTFTVPANDTVDFDQFGSPSQGGDIIITNGQGDTTTLRIIAATGKVDLI